MTEESDLIDKLLSEGVFDYGEIIQVNALMGLFGVKTMADDEMVGMSPNDMRALIKKEAVLELSVAGKVRERLLDEGRYIGKHGDYYRVYLPSENVSQAAAYQAAGQKKNSRAMRLLASTPVEYTHKTTAISRSAIAKIISDRNSSKKR